MERTYESTVVRFVAKIQPAENGCYEWIGGKYPTGYGYFQVFGKLMLAHRVSYILFTDPNLPDRYVVHHTCGNKGCVNPKHLEAMFGPDHYNMHRKERQRRSRDNGRT